MCMGRRRYNWGTSDLEDRPHRPGSASVAVNNEDGRALIAFAEKGGSAEIVTQFDTGLFKSIFPVVEIRGRA